MAQCSYSQMGEDLIISFIFQVIGIEKPTYLDIGAHDPIYLSNTWLFYEKGSSGVCVEPDPELYAKIKKRRPRDVCINSGVCGGDNSTANFYIMSARALNTFSREEAERYQSYGSYNIVETKKLPLVNINSIIRDNFKEWPNLISIDVEGMDFEILSSLDFDTYRPEVVCVETITYAEDDTQKKIPEILELMKSKGYMIFGDTYINTIFVDPAAWDRRLTRNK